MTCEEVDKVFDRLGHDVGAEGQAQSPEGIVAVGETQIGLHRCGCDL